MLLVGVLMNSVFAKAANVNENVLAVDGVTTKLSATVVELVTCWTIVLVISGVYLWWPRRRERVWGTFLPRLRRHPYVALRDLHAVSGFYVAAVALVCQVH